MEVGFRFHPRLNPPVHAMIVKAPQTGVLSCTFSFRVGAFSTQPSIHFDNLNSRVLVGVLARSRHQFSHERRFRVPDTRVAQTDTSKSNLLGISGGGSLNSLRRSYRLQSQRIRTRGSSFDSISKPKDSNRRATSEQRIVCLHELFIRPNREIMLVLFCKQSINCWYLSNVGGFLSSTANCRFKPAGEFVHSIHY